MRHLVQGRADDSRMQDVFSALSGKLESRPSHIKSVLPVGSCFTPPDAETHVSTCKRGGWRVLAVV